MAKKQYRAQKCLVAFKSLTWACHRDTDFLALFLWRFWYVGPAVVLIYLWIDMSILVKGLKSQNSPGKVSFRGCLQSQRLEPHG